MEKKVYQILANLTAALACVSTFFIHWDAQWSFPFVLFALALVFYAASWNLKYTFLGLVFSMPFIFNFNGIKINLASFPLFSTITNVDQLYINLSAAAYVLVIFIFFASFFLRKEKWNTVKSIPLFFVLIATVIFFFLSILWSASPQITLNQSIFSSVPFFFYLLAFLVINTYSDFLELLVIAVFSSALPLLVGVYQILTRDFFYEPDAVALWRITGPFHHPNNFGIYLFVIVSLTFLLIIIFRRKEHERMRKFLIFYLWALVPMFVLTYSRTGWLVALFFIFVLSFNKLKYLIKVIIFFGLLLSLLLVFEAPRERIQGIYDRSSADSVSVREGIFNIGVKKFLANPIIGYGIGNFEEQIMSEKETFDSTSFPHNDAILYTVEGGVVGLTLFFLITIGMYYSAIKYYRRLKNKKEIDVILFEEKITIDLFLLGKGVVIFLTAVYIASLAEALTRQPVIEITIWAVLGGWFSLMVKTAIKVND